jgi:exodeoxyribonuclease VII large subunit
MIETLPRSYTVSELTFALKKCIEPQFSKVTVKGEISNFKRQASGHIYFTIKDNQAQLTCAYFKGSQRGSVNLKDGDHVELFGEISIYPPRGNYQLIVRAVKNLGVGDLLLRFQKLKEELQKKGWFSPEVKKKLPLLPKAIAVITSPTGSVIRDIYHVLTRRHGGMKIFLYPAKVQGEGAVDDIVKGIEEINKHQLADVIIVARGGGSLEDLWSFNEEKVAAAVFHSKIPIISAVGHETDFTLCDFVSDVRAPTPSAAAEIVVKEKKHQMDFLQKSKHNLQKWLIHKMRLYHEKLQRIRCHPLFLSSVPLLRDRMQKQDDLKDDIDLSFNKFVGNKMTNLALFRKELARHSPKAKLSMKQSLLKEAEKRFISLMKHYLAEQKNGFTQRDYKNQMLKSLQNKITFYQSRLQQLKEHMQSIDPNNLLKKGYSILFSGKDNSIILSHKMVQRGDRICAKLADGKILAIVEENQHE